jgi:photosystem II stability/assembly factor-like uncharacterized protein
MRALKCFVLLLIIVSLNILPKPLTRLNIAPFRAAANFASPNAAIAAPEVVHVNNIGDEWSVVGPYGGDVKSLAIDPQNPQRLYLGTTDGQIYRSNDRGQRWTRLLSFSHPGYSVDKILIDETNPQILYVPVWYVANDTDGGIYKSTDGGDTWQELPAMQRHSVRALAIAPNNPRYLIAAAIDGAYRSLDAGATWQRFSPVNHPDIIRLHSVAIDPQNSDIVYLGTEHLPWKTTNGGKDWVCVKGHPTDKKQQFIDDSDIFSITVNRQDAQEVFASACSGIYHSRDGATNWEKYKGIPFTSRRTHIIYPHPTNNQTIYSGTTEGLWKTTDGGQNWRLLTSLRTVINAIIIHPDQPEKVYIGTKAGGVLVSDNGGDSFRATNEGFVNRQIATLVTDLQQKQRIYAGVLFNGTEGGLFISDDQGNSWRAIKQGLAGDIYAIYQVPETPNIIYAGTNLGLYRSTTRGESWTLLASNVPLPKPPTAKTPPPATLPAIAALNSPAAVATTVDNRQSRYVVHPVVAQKKKAASTPSKKATPAAKAIGVPAKITDRVVGVTTLANDNLFVASWSGLYQVVPSTGRSLKLKVANYTGKVLSIAGNAKSGRLFVGTAAGLYITNDQGRSWQVAKLAGEDRAAIQTIVISSHDANTILLATQNACYLSRDGGRGVPYGESLAVSFSPSNPDLVAITQYYEGGLYLSTDGGENFQPVVGVLPSAKLCAVAFDSTQPERLYVGSFSGGVYVLKLNSGRLTSAQR